MDHKTKGCAGGAQADFAAEMISRVKSECRMNIVEWEPVKSDYPTHILLGPDKGILAYINFIVSDVQGDICFRHERDALITKLRLAVSDLDRPVFNVCQVTEGEKKAVYFETYEQILDILFRDPGRLAGAEGESVYFCSEKSQMGCFEELLGIFMDLKKNNVRVY